MTSHASDIDPRGRPAAPSAGFRPHPAIESMAATWPLRERLERIGTDHARVEWEGKPATVQSVLDCAVCGRGVMILSPDTGKPGYLTSLSQVRAFVIRHLHANHETELPSGQ